MPGNEVGDRVHNFFAQDNLSQSQNQSQAAEGNWPILNNNLWVGNQRQISGQNPNQKNYSSHQSDLHRGHNGHPLHVPQGLHFTQSPLRPEYNNNQPQNQQPTLNGYMYQHQVFQPRQDEADLLGMDTESDRHKQNPRGLSIYESQQGSGAEHRTDNRRGLETSESPVSFDFFGGQRQMTDRNPIMLHAGYNEMQQQQLQQEAMLRKMQELHRQKELSQQLDARQHNTTNQIPFFPRQSSGNHPNDLINPGTQFSDVSSFPWANEQHRNTILRQRGSPAVQASSTGLGFLSDQGQIPYSMNPVHQQADQSLYGVPVSNSRVAPKQIQQFPADKPSPQQMPTFNQSFQAQQGNMFYEQGTMQDGRINSRQGFLGKNVASGMNIENLPQVNSASRNIPAHEFQGREELVGEMAQENSAFGASSSRDEVALDPTEEKILFGSDDNIWDALGKSGETSNLLDGMGSWSALMQSAVAETSSSDNGIQEKWTGLPFQNCQHSSTFTNITKRQTSLGDNNSQMAPALNFGYAPLSEGGNVKNNFNNPQGFQQHEQADKLQLNSSQRPSSSGGGGSKWLNQSSLAKPLPDGEINANNISSKRTPQQTGTNQLFNKPSSWNIHENGYPPQNEPKRQIHEEASQNDGIWKNSTPRNAEKPPNYRVSEEPTQFAQNPPPSFWKNVDSHSKSKGSEQLQQHPNKGPQFFETPLNMYEKQAGKLQDMEQKKENSSDSYHSNNASTGGLRDIVLSDASDSRTLPSGKQISGQAVKKPMAAVPPRMFQYHPMGNLDEDVEHSYGVRQSSLSQPNSQGVKNQHQEQGYFGKPNQFTQVYNSSESGKGKSPDHRGDPKGFDHLPGYPPNRSVHVDRSAGLFPPNKASQPSQNMLELLHKVDQSKEHGSTTHMSSSEQKSSSEMHEPENSDGSGGCLQRSQSSASQGFGLQLAPPSQRLPPQNHPSMVSRDNGVQSLFPSQQASQIQGEFVSSRFGFGFPLSTHQLQHMGSQMPSNQSVNLLSVNQQVSQSKPLDSTGQSTGASFAAETPDSTGANRIKQGGFPNMWTNVPETRKGTPNISQSRQSNVVESPSSAQTVEDQDEKSRGSASMEFGATSANSQGVVHNKVQKTNKNPSQKVNESQGQETVIKNFPNVSPSNVASMARRDIAAFGHSLKPNNAFNQNYSLLNQIQGMKNAEADPNIQGLKRFKGAENIPEGSKAAEQNVLGSTGPSSDNWERASSSENNTTSMQVENTPQMAPSWLSQLGNFRNGQMLSVIDSRKAGVVTASAVEQLSAVDKSFGGLHTLNSMEEAVNISSVAHTNQNDIADQTSLVPTEQLASSSKTVPTTNTSDISAQNVFITRPKKRKSSTPERCSWHKQISQASESLHTISTAEAEWARATYRLADRVEDDLDLMDDVSANQKAKRRLKSTTQLMQQLIRPPPYSILSVDVISDYESSAHYVSRLALGDACSLLSSTSSSNSHSKANLNVDNRVSDVLESFADRARKLGNELLRLDKRASVSELRLECEDVETFSVINRFAKFHGRPKPERCDSSDAAASNAQKIFPQRYVTAVPVSRHFPDRVNCISL